MTDEKKWFETWFDTPYYHLLYSNRDEQEARRFLDHLSEHISLQKDAKVLDLACGKGRHAIYLAEKGLDVTGYDLSPSNIREANKSAHEHLRFEIRDMREDLSRGNFEAIFNLFTGFGYFDSDEENFSVFGRVYEALKPGGLFIFDYLNSEYVKHLPKEPHNFEIEGITFSTRKIITGKKVIKEIDVSDGPNKYHFKEEVTLYSPDEIEAALRGMGFHILSRFGDYDLGPYNELSSRLIIICRKTI